jgi:hypothetical protein
VADTRDGGGSGGNSIAFRMEVQHLKTHLPSDVSVSPLVFQPFLADDI